MQVSRIVNFYSFLIIFKFTTVSAARVYGTCITPTDELANCIKLEECRFLFEVLNSPTLSANDRHYLRASQCGNNHTDVYICCPEDYISYGIETSTAVSSPTVLPTTPAPTLRFERILENSTLPQPPVCGTYQKDIFGRGKFRNLMAHPWSALPLHRDEFNSYSFFCGGALITNQHVITSASCLTKTSMAITHVRLGEWDLKFYRDCVSFNNGDVSCADPYVDIEIESAFIYPEYNPSDPTSAYDIAIVTLIDKVTFTEFIKPICLPTDNEFFQQSFENLKMIVVGWGHQDRLTKSAIKQNATVTVWEQSKCSLAYSKRDQKGAKTIKSNQMCAGGDGVYPCNADTGSPLVVEMQINNIQAHYLAGIVSFGNMDCELASFPTIYTRVPSFINWIVDSINTTDVHQS